MGAVLSPAVERATASSEVVAPTPAARGERSLRSGVLGDAPGSSSERALPRLQATAGNAVVVRLLRSREMVRRDEVDELVARLRETSSLTTLAVLLPKWDLGLRRQVAAHLGVERFKDLVIRIGSSKVADLPPEPFLAVDNRGPVPSLQDIGVILKDSGAKPADLASVGGEWKAPLGAIIGGMVALGATLDTIRPYILKADPQQRQEASADQKMLQYAKVTLVRDDYLGLLPALAVYEKSTTGTLSESPEPGHMSPSDADKLIQTQIQRYVAEAVKAGRKMEGEISVVGDDDYQMAFNRQWVDTGFFQPGTDAKATCNAFVDVNLPKRHIWVHRDLGNFGTVVHEGMHKYASSVLRDEQMSLVKDSGGISQLDEGITEYFARLVLGTSVSRTNYQVQWQLADALVHRVGEPTVAKAYFDGALPALKTAFESSKKKTGAWAPYAQAFEEQKYQEIVQKGLY